MNKVIIYTDGACSGNPGPGGWGTILMYKDTKKEISGGNNNTTNNIMEITAVIEGLKMLKYECEVEIYSDSAYVVKELWEELYELTKKHKVTFIKVKGHADNEYNNRCDELARRAIIGN